MHSIKNIYEKIYDFENLHKAWEKAIGRIVETRPPDRQPPIQMRLFPNVFLFLLFPAVYPLHITANHTTVILYGNPALKDFPKTERYVLAGKIRESMYTALEMAVRL